MGECRAVGRAIVKPSTAARPRRTADGREKTLADPVVQDPYGRRRLSVRRASERCNVARDTAQRAFAELQKRGFIELVTKGAFSRKVSHASDWRFTFWTCDLTGEQPTSPILTSSPRIGNCFENVVSCSEVEIS